MSEISGNLGSRKLPKAEEVIIAGIWRGVVAVACLLASRFCPVMDGMEFTSTNGELHLNGRRFHLKGCNWFGFETETKVIHGIWSHSLESFLEYVAHHNFNALRIPFAANLAFELDTFVPTAVNTTANPHLANQTSGFIMDYLVREAAKRGILIMLDMHVLTTQAGITDLWHMNGFSEEKLFKAWSIMANRYLNYWNVFAYDLKNEPHDSATWGDGHLHTDWRLAAERLGNALLAINPKALIFVEGTSGKQYPKTTSEAAFWGGSLASARETPVRLHNPNKLVYSPHVYGPGVHLQEYFKDKKFPKNMPKIWTKQWGHILHAPKAGPAVVIGEWGGFFKDDLEKTWAEAFVDYLKVIRCHDQFFWCLNPNSGDTGGLLEDDWRTPTAYKLDLIHRLCPSPSRILVDSYGNPTEVEYGGCGHHVSAPTLDSVQDILPAVDQAENCEPFGDSTETDADPGHGSGTEQENLANMPSMLDIEVDSSAVPHLVGTAKVIKSWTEGDKGQMFQVEASIVDLGPMDIPNVIVEFSKDAKLSQVWNLEPGNETNIYSLPKWSTDQGGLKPNNPISWGGIFGNPNLKLKYLPFRPPSNTHVEL